MHYLYPFSNCYCIPFELIKQLKYFFISKINKINMDMYANVLATSYSVSHHQCIIAIVTNTSLTSTVRAGHEYRQWSGVSHSSYSLFI